VIGRYVCVLPRWAVAKLGLKNDLIS
jgi:hypothetical protein